MNSIVFMKLGGMSIIGEPQVKPYEHIDNPSEFWVKYSVTKKPVKRWDATRKLDGTNIRLVKDGPNFVIMTRNQVASSKFTELTKKAITPEIETMLRNELIQDGDYLVFELEGKENKTPYASDIPIRLVGIEAFIEGKSPANYRELFAKYGVPTPEEFEIKEITKKTIKDLAEEAYKRDWEGAVIKVFYEDGGVLRGKVKPFHFGLPFKGKVDKSATVGIDESKYVSESAIIDELHKLKQKLSKEDFVNPKILMPLLMKELRSEYPNKKVTKVFPVYQQFCIKMF